MRGLRWQLAIFYLLLSIPALLLIEHSIVAFEFQRCVRELDDGRVQRVLDREADQISAAQMRGIHPDDLQDRLDRFVLQLERPRESLGTEAAYVLLELSEHPFTAELTRGDSALPTPARGIVHRVWQAQVSSSEVLRLQLQVPSPWHHFERGLSFEWPIAVAYLLLFLIGSATFLRIRVLRRLATIGLAAKAWARGDFSRSLSDSSADELGELARALNQMAHDLKAQFVTRAQLAALEERRRLARDLHDTVKQKMFALSLQIDAQRAAPNARTLDEAVLLVGEIQRELSDLLRELRADADQRDDLVPALRQRGVDFARRSGIALEADLPESCPMSPRVADAVFRIVDEALANIWRHAQTELAWLKLARQADGWLLTVRDDGCGGAAPKAPGMGLGNLQQRASAIGAVLTIASVANQGTTISLLCRDQT